MAAAVRAAVNLVLAKRIELCRMLRKEIREEEIYRYIYYSTCSTGNLLVHVEKTKTERETERETE